MGAIQNSINQSIGAVMGGAIAMEHLSEKIDTKTKEAANLTVEHQKETDEIKPEYKKAVAEEDNAIGTSKRRTDEVTAAQKSLEEFKANKHPQYTEGENKGKFMSKEDRKKELIKRRHDLKKLTRAAEEEAANLQGKTAQKELLEKRIAAVNARVQVANKQLGHYGYKSPEKIEIKKSNSELTNTNRIETEAR